MRAKGALPFSQHGFRPCRAFCLGVVDQAPRGVTTGSQEPRMRYPGQFAPGGETRSARETDEPRPLAPCASASANAADRAVSRCVISPPMCPDSGRLPTHDQRHASALGSNRPRDRLGFDGWAQTTRSRTPFTLTRLGTTSLSISMPQPVHQTTPTSFSCLALVSSKRSNERATAVGYNCIAHLTTGTQPPPLAKCPGSHRHHKHERATRLASGLDSGASYRRERPQPSSASQDEPLPATIRHPRGCDE